MNRMLDSLGNRLDIPSPFILSSTRRAHQFPVRFFVDEEGRARVIEDTRRLRDGFLEKLRLASSAHIAVIYSSKAGVGLLLEIAGF